MSFLRSVIKIAINHFGYDVRRVPSPSAVYIAPEGTDPITFEYRKDLRGHAVIEVPIRKLRAFHALALPLEPACHPFVRAVTLALRTGSEEEARAAIEEVLGDYYEQVRPRTAADVLGVPMTELPGFRDHPPATDNHPIDVAAVPWSGRTPAEIKLGRERTANFEGLQNGVIASADDGVTSFGPVKAAKLQLEVQRLTALMKSVRRHGFRRFDPRSPLQVGAFRRDDEYAWVINHGQHRFATAAAFGLDTIPAMVTEVVRREDAPYWPQVVGGLFTVDAARSIFDRVFEGVPAPICDPWIGSIEFSGEKRASFG